MTYDHPATWETERLTRVCHTRRQRRSGPGGQHRNKVETAFVYEHEPSGLRGEASERRSQEQNRKVALFRLRLNLALGLREAIDLANYVPSAAWQSRCRGGRVSVSPNHEMFPSLLAEALDVMVASASDPRSAAERLACTPSQLVKFLQSEPRAIAQINKSRQELGLFPLK